MRTDFHHTSKPTDYIHQNHIKPYDGTKYVYSKHQWRAIIKGQSELVYECITRTYNEVPITHMLRGLSSVSSL